MIAVLLALAGLGGLIVAGAGVRDQFRPRTFSAAQQARIRAWEVASRWRTTPKTAIFPDVIGYHLTAGARSQSTGPGLKLNARRLAIAPQGTCTKAAGGSVRFMSLLARDDCTALLRSTYTDASSSFVVTTGIAVLKDQAAAMAAAHYLTRGPATGLGGLSSQLVLRPYRVGGSPAAWFTYPQRQLSWVVAAGPYLVMATAGYSDGRPRLNVKGDVYVRQEMMSLISGIAHGIAKPLGVVPPVPSCPGEPAC